MHKAADLNIKDNLGRTALYFASRKGHIDIMRLLKEGGAKRYLFWL